MYVDCAIGLAQTRRSSPIVPFSSDSMRLLGVRDSACFQAAQVHTGRTYMYSQQFSSGRRFSPREDSPLKPPENTMPTYSNSQGGVLTSKHLFDRSASQRHCGRKDARNINIGYRPQRPSYPPGPAIINSPFWSRSRHRIYTSAAAVTSITPQCSHSHGKFRLACEACKSCKNYSIR